MEFPVSETILVMAALKGSCWNERSENRLLRSRKIVEGAWNLLVAELKSEGLAE